MAVRVARVTRATLVSAQRGERTDLDEPASHESRKSRGHARFIGAEKCVAVPEAASAISIEPKIEGKWRSSCAT